MPISTFLNRLRSRDDTSDASPVTSLRLGSGPGAPMFEHGSQTRIRRAPVRAIASFTWPGGPEKAYGQVCNISPGGCLLKTETTIAAGTQLDLHVVVVGRGRNKRIKADVRGVVRRRTLDGERNAYGVEFIACDRADRELHQWLYARVME